MVLNIGTKMTERIEPMAQQQSILMVLNIGTKMVNGIEKMAQQ
jgi:hypothetical protein